MSQISYIRTNDNIHTPPFNYSELNLKETDFTNFNSEKKLISEIPKKLFLKRKNI